MHQARHERPTLYQRVEVITGDAAAAELEREREGSDHRRERGAGGERFRCRAPQRREPRLAHGVASTGSKRAAESNGWGVRRGAS